MRNLKRMLSLAMAAVMLVGMMVVGASAATTTNFPDRDKIEHKDAVNTLVSLGVILGKDDGTFDPEGIVTRAEMAKMICVALNGGRDPNLSSTTSTSYPDTVGNWASGYIEYCTNLGIVAGDNTGNFNPSKTVTGTEAAKMLLVAIGYQAEAEGFVGAKWASMVDLAANDKDLYNDLADLQPSEGLSRDAAAQMVYNAINAQMVEYNYNPVTENGQINLKPVRKDKTALVSGSEYAVTILSDKFGMITAYGYMTGFSYDSDRNEYTYTFTNSAAFGSGAITNNSYTGTLKTDADYTDMFGMKVKVLYKNNTDKTVYGMYTKDSAVLADAFSGNLPETIKNDAGSVKVDGETIKLTDRADQTPVYSYNGVATGEKLDDLSSTDALYAIQLLDNDGDGKADVAVKTPLQVLKVNYVGKDSVTFQTLGSKDFDDIEIYDGVSKDDYVLYIAPAYAKLGVPTFTEATVVTGSITGSKSGNQFLVDGDWMVNTTATNLSVNDDIEYIALGGRIYYAKVVSGATGSQALAMVYRVAINSGSGTSTSKVEAKMIFADGTKKTVNIAKVNGVDVSNFANVNVATISGGSDATGNAVTPATLQATLIGELVNYKVNNDGDYELKTIKAGYTPIGGAKILGYDSTLAAQQTYVYSSNSIGSVEVAKDAAIFVLKGTVGTEATTNDAKVYTGTELKNTGNVFGTTGATYASGLVGKTSGFSYVQAAVLQNATFPNITTGANYGYLTSDAYTGYDKSDSKDYIYFTYWDGDSTVNAKAEGTDVTGFVAGAVITFDTGSGDLIKNVKVPSTTTGAVTGWDGVKKISLDNSNKEISDETVVLYVNSKNTKGIKGDIGMINEAADVDGDSVLDDNVRYILTGANGIALLVVDETNVIQPAPAFHVSNVADAITELGVTANVTLDASIAAGGWSTILSSLTAGKTLTVNGNVDAAAAAQTLAAGATLVVTGTFTTDSANAFTVNGTLDVGTLTTTTGMIAAGANGVIKASVVSTMSDIEGLATATIVLKTAGNTGSASTWYSDAGKNKGTEANSGVAATAITTLPAGTYVHGTIYTDNNGTTGTGWVLQK